LTQFHPLLKRQTDLTYFVAAVAVWGRNNRTANTVLPANSSSSTANTCAASQQWKKKKKERKERQEGVGQHKKNAHFFFYSDHPKKIFSFLPATTPRTFFFPSN